MDIDINQTLQIVTTWGPRVLGAILIFFIGWTLAGMAYRSALGQIDKRGLDPALGRFLAALARWTVIGASVIAALGTVGIQTTSLVAVFASAGVAIGLALQGSLSNFASGVLLLVFRPFDIQDVVSVGGSTGQVMEIGLFATTLHTPDGQRIIVPNSAVTGSTIVNVTVRGTRRAEVAVGVAYGEDPDRVMAVLANAARSCEAVLPDPDVAVVFVGLGDSSIDFVVRGWAKSGEYFDALHQIRKACYKALNEEGIEIPYPQVVMHQSPVIAAAS